MALLMTGAGDTKGVPNLEAVTKIVVLKIMKMIQIFYFLLFFVS